VCPLADEDLVEIRSYRPVGAGDTDPTFSPNFANRSATLVVACAAVLLGTIYPLVIDALNLGKLSVGPQ
jgi:cytochrome c-type biogenesis protein CcmF